MRRGRRGESVDAVHPLVRQLMDELGSTLDEGRVDLLGVNRRPRWLLADLQTSSGRRMFAKLATPSPEPAALPRPRLVSLSSSDGHRLRSEAAALRRLTEAVPEDDPDLAAISVVHWQESPPALVVDWVAGQPLSRVVSSLRSRDRRARFDLMRRAGRWLRLFHSLGEGEPVAYRYPGDVLKWLTSVDLFLGRGREREACRDLVDELGAAIEAADLDPPALGLHHGDMAARNLMVRDDGRIVGIDAGVSWQAPRAHDLAVFVSDLHLRSVSERRGHRRGDEFLAAYASGGRENPVTDIFYAVAVVDRHVAWRVRFEEQDTPRWRWKLEGARLDRLARHAVARLGRS